jgi:hypothetical protein
MLHSLLQFSPEEMTEQEELLKEYQQEIEKCWELAQKLDSLNPDLVGAFTGSPSERIERQLYTLGILN